MFQLFDRFEIDDAAKVHRTKDGYLTAMPRVARTGIQLYRGSEVGRPDIPVVRVMRPEAEVFKTDSLQSFAYKPFTDDHPKENVTADNWAKYAKGQAGGDVARDGQFIRIPMALMDGATIKKFDDGKAELSVGYSCELIWGDGETDDGQAFDAMQTNIRCNHIAVVEKARGGKDLRIGDGAGAQVNFADYAAALGAVVAGKVDTGSVDDGDAFLASDGKGYPVSKAGTVYVGNLRAAKANAIAKGDSDILAAVDSMLSLIGEPKAPSVTKKDTKPMKTMVVDGVTCEMSDTAIEVVTKALKAANDAFNFEKKAKEEEEEKGKKAKKEAEDSIAAKDAEIVKKDAEIVALKAQVADSAITPAKLDALVADRKTVSDLAKALLPAVVVDGKTTSEIRKQVVDDKMGDRAKAYTEDQVTIAFDSLTSGIDLTKGATQDAASMAGYRPGGFQDTARAFSQPPQNTNDREAIYDKRDKRLQDAWKSEGGKA